MPRRRSVTLTVAGVLLAAFGVVAFTQPVPYAEESPGPTFPVSGTYQGTQVITITGHQTYQSSGELRMVTVGVSGEDWQMPLLTALRGWWSSDTAIVPKETVYPPGETQQESDTQNTEDFTGSQDEATIAALNELGIKPTGSDVVVEAVSAGTPADGKLQPGDIIDSVDGTAIGQGGTTGMTLAQNVIRKVTPGRQVTFVVTRDDAKKTVVTGTTDNKGVPMVGIALGSSNLYPFQVDIQLEGVGGPSAGMMFALGIINKLTPGGVTGGRIIAGTGTIDADGNVGAIGGIQMKMIGARRDGATVFLAPADNCAEAKADVPAGLELVRVSTLRDALNALQDLREGKTPPSC
jgi:Lon-like protease